MRERWESSERAMSSRRRLDQGSLKSRSRETCSRRSSINLELEYQSTLLHPQPQSFVNLTSNFQPRLVFPLQLHNMDPSESSIPLRSTFPIDPAEFDSDPRISFSKLDSKFILETTDGEEFEYDDALRRWIPSVCLSSISVWLLYRPVKVAISNPPQWFQRPTF